MTEQGVTEQVIFDHCCSVNANFVFQGLRVKPTKNFQKKGGGVYDFREEDSNGMGSFWKGAWEGSESGEFRFSSFFFWQKDLEFRLSWTEEWKM
jgi:hypothetical protein